MIQGQWLRHPTNDLTVVFIHGINSSEACWRHSNGTYWPELLRDENNFSSIGVYVFSYRTTFMRSNYSLGDVVDSLKEYLALDEVLQHSRVIFVCHSMGGIVARRFLVTQQLELLRNGLREVGLFLVASPSLGSNYANMLGYLINVMGVSRFIGNTQTEALKFSQKNTWLNDLHKDFINLRDVDGFKIKGKELIEELSIIPFTQEQIVEPFSGAIYFPDSITVPGSDHSTIARPESNQSFQHRLLCNFIREFRTQSNSITNPLQAIEVNRESNLSADVNVALRNEPFKIHLIGRSEEKRDILEDLTNPNSPPAIGIWGMGGIGKTRIAREIYDECKKQQSFRVGWIDPSNIFIGNTGSEYSPAFETALDRIAQILDRSDLQRLEGEKKKNEIVSLLRSNSVLFIFDNMETLGEEQDKVAKDLISLFSDSQSKLIFTSRRKFTDQDYPLRPIRLRGLDTDDGVSLIREISRVKKFDEITNASDEILVTITERLGGLPLALNLAISQVDSIGVNSVLESFQDVSFSSGNDNDYSRFYRFIFLNSWKLIDSNCKKILYILAERPEGRSKREGYIERQSGLPKRDLRDAIQKTWKYAFIEKQNPLEELGSYLYSLHPLTRNFVRTDIKNS